MKEIQITLTVEQAKELFKTNPEYRNTLLAKFNDEDLGIDNFPKSWEELGKIGGCYIYGDSSIAEVGCFSALSKHNRNLYPTTLDAKKALAEAQLRQIAYRCNGNQNEEEWCDWSDKKQHKYYLFINWDKAYNVDYATCIDYGAIYFKNKEHLERSFFEHKELWDEWFKKH